MPRVGEREKKRELAEIGSCIAFHHYLSNDPIPWATASSSQNKKNNHIWMKMHKVAAYVIAQTSEVQPRLALQDSILRNRIIES